VFYTFPMAARAGNTGVSTLTLTIGSGEVMGALTCDGHPCWSETLALPLRNAISFADSTKDLKKTVKDMLGTASVAGMRALHKYQPDAQITRATIELSAPWAVTVARTARVRHSAEFAVTPELLAKLERHAIQGAIEATEAARNGALVELALIENETIGLLINGYPAKPGHEAHGETVSLTQLMSFAYREVETYLTEVVTGTFGQARATFTSSMARAYRELSRMPGHADACIVLVGGEVTELGIVRDGVLQFASYTPYGVRTLARELRDNCNMTIATALSFMGSDTLTYESSKESIDEVLSLYETNLVELFERGGDPFFMPQAFYVVCGNDMTAFFRERIAHAVLGATKRAPSIFAAPRVAQV
jgi:hypothetical protein